MLIVYLSGFGTAIYCLAPPANITREAMAASQASFASTASDRLLQASRIVLHKGKEVGQDLVDRASVLIQYKYAQKPANDESEDTP